MTWTYNLAALATAPLSQVRLLIGDTDIANPLLQDEEINFFLIRRPNTYGAAAEACRSLSVRFATEATTKAGDSEIMYSDISKAFALRAQTFESQAANSGSGSPYAGGISQSDKFNQEQDTDRVAPQFALNVDDNYTSPVAPASDSDPSGPSGG